MNQSRFWFQGIVLFSLMMFTGMQAGCSSDSVRSNNEALRIYEMAVAKGSFAAVAGDATATRFQLNLSEVPDEILYFTNRGATEGGYDTVENVINNIWPKVYGKVAPNAIMKATTEKGAIELFSILDKPLYNKASRQLTFTIIYLDGKRPVANLALTDVKLIITNNAETVYPAVWSHLLAGDVGTFTPTATEGTYTFRIQKTIGSAFGYTCAPQRKSSATTVKEYIQSWNTRFGNSPPNATIAYDPTNDQIGGVQIVTLTNPKEEADGSISFTAKVLFSAFLPIGKNGLTVKNPSLFIDGGADGFPTYDKNVFSIQYRNSTSDAITVWFDGTQPPCSVDETENCTIDTAKPEEYSDAWKDLDTAGVFERSKTYFYVVAADGKTSKKVSVSNHIDLEKGETLRIVPPIVDGYPQWVYDRKTRPIGVAQWVTKKGINMPALLAVHKFEYTLDFKRKIINADMSGADGVNLNVTMAYEGPGCGDDINCGSQASMPRVCKVNLDAFSINPFYGTSNEGCPYIMKLDNGALTCSHPIHYPETGAITSANLMPDWVIPLDQLTTYSVGTDTQFLTIWNDAKAAYEAKLKKVTKDTKGKEIEWSGRVLALASVPPEIPENLDAIKKLKQAYHIWWATNPVAQGWLNYLQRNSNGNCEQYGWAFDEYKWHPNDTFNNDGNPLKSDGTQDSNDSYKPNWEAPFKSDTYLNIEILKIM